ncbi:MAG: hypothetical protein ACXWG9_16370 [Usitatibacter sp.]
MISNVRGNTGVLARFGLALLAVAGIVSCSGAVSDNTVVSSSPISLLPASATLYSNLPTTFVVSGGNGNYVVTSSDQATIPAVGSFTGNSFTVVPNPVAADTPVTLTVRDTGAATAVNATLTVKPRTVSNVVTITPSPTQPAACGSAVCAGGDAEVKATLSQAGVPLQGHEVRFDVVSGDFRIITSAPGTPETLSLSGTTFSDSTGTARIRIRALSDASSRTALLQITDVSTGAFQRTPVSIATASNAPLNAQPTTVSFVGATNSTCANGIFADVIVFGGRPPYSISQPGTFSVSPTVVGASGGRFTIGASGQCTTASPIAVVDTNGASVTVTASNVVAAVTVTVPTFVVSPTTVTIDSCTSVATVAIAGGLGPSSYFAASGNSAVTAFTIGSNNGFIQRRAGSPLTTATTVEVAFSDGRSVQSVTVNLLPGAMIGC